MGPEMAGLARQLKQRGTKIVFDCNVDYLTPASGAFYYEGMAPTEAQRASCVEMLALSDGVIADSSHIQKRLAAAHSRVTWIPDNVRDDMLSAKPRAARIGPLVLQWSGEAVKLFDLLVLKDVLPQFGSRIKLRLVTSDLAALNRWPVLQREAFETFLGTVPHEIVPFTTLDDLMKLYDTSDVVLSPRFLDSSYNLGHTEWKITLGMARGCVALCSTQPSYLDVASRANGQGIRVCTSPDDWRAALNELLSDSFDWASGRAAATDVVTKQYATSVIAEKHLGWLRALIGESVS